MCVVLSHSLPPPFFYSNRFSNPESGLGIQTVMVERKKEGERASEEERKRVQRTRKEEEREEEVSQ